MDTITNKIAGACYNVLYPLAELLALSIIASGVYIRDGDGLQNESVANEAIDIYRKLTTNKELEDGEEETDEEE